MQQSQQKESHQFMHGTFESDGLIVGTGKDSALSCASRLTMAERGK